MSVQQPTNDREHIGRCLRWEITTADAAHHVAAARALRADGRLPAEECAMLDDADRRYPEATHPERYRRLTFGPDIETDPETATAFDQLVDQTAGTGRRRPRRRHAGANGNGAKVLPLRGDDIDEPAPELEPVPGRPDHGYTLDPPGVWRHGDRSPLLDWCPEVTERLERLDGSGQLVETRWMVQIGQHGPVLLTARDLGSAPVDGSCWVDRFPGVTGVGAKTRRELLLDVVMAQAAQLDATWLVQRNGWHRLPDGTWCYVRTPQRRVRPVYGNTNIAAAYEPVGVHSAGEVTGAIDQVAEHGWGPVLGLAEGARALVQSLVPVPHAVVHEGPPNAGKSLAAWMAQLLVLSPRSPDGRAWPPVPDASFVDTVNSMERKIGEAADRVVHINDMPLTAESTGTEMRTAVEKLDRLVRAQHDNTPVRDRMNRRLELEESTFVRGVLVFTVQRLPGVVQASLWRRMVLARFAAGDNDWRWYRDHGAGLVGPIRSLGDRMIRALEAMGAEQAAELVRTCDRIGRERLWATYRTLGAGDVAGMDGVADSAGQLAGGLVLIERLTGIAAGRLVDVLVPELAKSLEAQAGLMADRQAVDADVTEALGGLLRKACLDRRAHVRDPREDHVRPMVPGLTRQAQGVPDEADRAQGVPLYVFTDRRCVGVTAKDLHTLAGDGRDPRLSGFTAEGLARHLLAEAASVPSRQKGKAAVHRERIGHRDDNVRRYLVMVPWDVVWDLDGDDDEPAPVEPSPSTPEPPPPPAAPAPLPLDAPTEAPEPPGERPTPSPALVTRPAASTGQGTAQGRRSGPASSTPPAVMVAVEGDGLAVRRPESGGQWEFRPGVGAGDLVAVMAAVAELVPAGPVIVLVAESEHRRCRLPVAPPRSVARPPKVFRRLVEAGWHRPGYPEQPPYVTRYARVGHRDREGVALVLPVRWMGPGEWPRLDDDAGDIGAVELADRLAGFRAAVGWDLNGSTSATGVRMFRDLVSVTARRTPYWNPTGQRSWPDPSTWGHWRREPAGAEGTEVTHVHAFDAVACYLPAMRQAALTPEDLRHHDEPQFDEHEAGYWRIIVPPWPHPHTPAPILDVDPGHDTWTTTAVVRLYVELGMSPELLESWTAQRRHFAGQRQFADHLRDVLANPATPADVRPGVKRLYQSFHGKTRSLDQTVIGRPDWGHAIRDEAWCALLRKVYQGAGMLPLPHNATGGERRFTATPLYPVEISQVDTVIYAGGSDPVAPESFTIGEQLGGFRLKTSTTVNEWREGA